MSEHQPDEGSPTDTDTGTDSTYGVTDDQLPPDLQPTEDNPLARHPAQTGDADDAIGANVEGDPQTAPMTEEDSAYGHGSDSASGPDDGRATAEEDDGSSTLADGGGGAG
jgi:hypothetical protein